MARWNPTFTEQELQNEQWRDVVGYEGIYSVSDLGRIKRDAPRSSNTGGTCQVGRILKPWLARGYPQVHLNRDGEQRAWTIHVLVARAFLGPCPPGKEVNHEDGVKTNTRLSNFSYATHMENEAHAVAHHLKAFGERNGAYTHPEKIRRGFTRDPTNIVRGEQQHDAKLTDETVREMRRMYANGGISYAELGRRNGVSKAIAMRAVKRKLWKHVS